MKLNDLSPEALESLKSLNGFVENLEGLVALIKSIPEFRLLTRLKSPDFYFVATERSVIRKAVIMDTETTGMAAGDKVIELGMILFEFDAVTGEVYRVLERFDELEDPEMPIPAQATKVNGITDEMVKGKRINDAEVSRIVSQADVVIAHNSGFDRSYAEERWPIFGNKAWACSLKQVNWAAEGLASAKLEYIAMTQGFFYDAHRAISDCEALLHALQQPLPETGTLGMKYIVDAYQQVDFNIGAVGSPFSTKDKLTARRVAIAEGVERKYFWKGEEPKFWHIDLPENLVEAEIQWLQANIYFGKSFQVSVSKIDAYNRFAKRDVERELRNIEKAAPQPV